MITKCRFCDYERSTPFSLDILRVAISTDIEEDMALWMKRLIKTHGIKDWASVKIHMGRMHKENAYAGMWPDCEFSPEEKAVINKNADSR